MVPLSSSTAKRKELSMGIKRVADLAWNRLLTRVDNSTGKLIIVLERARLVRTSLAAKFTECTWRL